MKPIHILVQLIDSIITSFSSSIFTFSPFSVLCRLHYPSGTLQNFLQSRIHQLTEIGLHKITLDVATGLEYIHQHHLVHNGLTTHTVYMASVSEVGLLPNTCIFLPSIIHSLKAYLPLGDDRYYLVKQFHSTLPVVSFW